jgi:hypothetical protein
MQFPAMQFPVEMILFWYEWKDNQNLPVIFPAAGAANENCYGNINA